MLGAMMVPIRSLGLAGLLVLPAGCSDDDCEQPLRVCDIGSASCQEHVFIQTACARGHGGRTLPAVSTITRDEFEEFLRAGDPPTAEQSRADAQIATALRMLRLLPPGQTSNEEAAIAAYASSVLAFYSRADRSVTIVETNLGDVSLESGVFVLSHEFVHAQQDVDVGLQEFFDEHAVSSDASTATRSVTEGEAVHYSNITMARQEGASITAEIFEEYYDIQQELLRTVAAGVGGEEASYTEVSSVFPYFFGGEVVTDRWMVDGDAGVLELYDAPPPSTAAILRTLAEDPPLDGQALAVAAEPLPAGWSVVADDTLGAWVLYAYARRIGLDDPGADALARAWVGDRILVGGGAVEGEVAVAWSIRFATAGHADTFASASVTPPEGVQSVRVDGTDVALLIAVDEPTLMEWEGAVQTAELEEGTSSFRRARLAPPLPRPVREHPPHVGARR